MQPFEQPRPGAPIPFNARHTFSHFHDRRWNRLHRLVYVAAFAGVLHYFWLVKKDIHYPLLYGIVLIALLGIRVWWVAERTRARPKPAGRPVQVDPAL